MTITVCEAESQHIPSIVRLIAELAASGGERSTLTAAYVQEYLLSPSSHVLLAESDGQAVGLLSFSIRPDLYHAADTALIEELVVQDSFRGQGIGGMLLDELLRRLEALGCAEVSVTTMPDNQGALRFYRAHGLTDEAVFLERHFE